MDKHIEETRSIYYESSQDSHLSDSDWYPSSQESEVSTDSSQEITYGEDEHLK